ncbi:MAG: GNAT family protein [Spirochaetia bacterium]|nr:GNAT family protein [Spirochaetia bacterium]
MYYRLISSSGRIVITGKAKGFGKETIKRVITYAFESLKMNRFWLDVYPDNYDGIKLYESLGMIREGTLRQNYKSERGYLDQIIYSLLETEYNELKQNNKF